MGSVSLQFSLTNTMRIISSASLLLATCHSQMLERLTYDRLSEPQPEQAHDIKEGNSFRHPSEIQPQRAHDIKEGNSFRYPSAPNPSYEYYCPYPEQNFPGSGYQNITQRIESSAYAFYAKALEKKVTKTSLYGQEYDVLWSLECDPLKQPGGTVIPQTFWMSGLGRFGPNYIPCGPRNVVTGFNYVFFGQ